MKWVYDSGVSYFQYKAPVIGSGGTVYMLTGRADAWLHAIDKDGKLKWNLRLDLNAMYCSAPTISKDDVIYISTWEDGKLYAIGEGN
jgi:outer membrane protein assembly factor BamB